MNEKEGDWKLIGDIITAGAVHHNITAKIRVFDNERETENYVRAISKTEIVALTVHGRTIEQKKDKTGIASFKMMKIARDCAPNIPGIYLCT